MARSTRRHAHVLAVEWSSAGPRPRPRAPSWLDRLLPHVDVEGSSVAPAPADAASEEELPIAA
ncbi:MAG TPA: hypothetical protein VGD29_03715 [Actinoplanes sp.]